MIFFFLKRIAKEKKLIKKAIKSKFKNNILCWYYYKRVIAFFDINLIKYNIFLRKIRKIDSIKNFELFKSKIQKKVGKILVQDAEQYGEESKYYGHYKALCEYAGWEKERFPLIQRVEHGVRFVSDKWRYNDNDLVYACQGANRKSDIYDKNLYCPIFALGPYIHYVSDYWSKKEFEEYKTQIGKTLLVFPSHSCEGEEIIREKSFVDIIYDKYAHNFSTILVCIYWNDVNDDIVNAFQKRGAVLVSAGFRGDYNFIKRLKTIIKLSDMVVVDGLGTNIGYCMYLKKPVYLEGNQMTGLDDVYYTHNFHKFKEAFYSETFAFKDVQLVLQKELYKEFWGGDECIRTSEELYNIFAALYELYHITGYKRDNLKVILKRIVEGKRVKFKKNSLEKNHLLRLSMMK